MAAEWDYTQYGKASSVKVPKGHLRGLFSFQNHMLLNCKNLHDKFFLNGKQIAIPTEATKETGSITPFFNSLSSLYMPIPGEAERAKDHPQHPTFQNHEDGFLLSTIQSRLFDEFYSGLLSGQQTGTKPHLHWLFPIVNACNPHQPTRTLPTWCKCLDDPL